MSEIESFAELGEFFDRPVKLYSSGMMVRLAFSMFACFEPDVLIVDEALSVGDVYFQQKCVRRIRQMLDAGTTMLLVSHDLVMVRRLCHRAAVLFNSRLVFSGNADHAVNFLDEIQQKAYRELDPAKLDSQPFSSSSRNQLPANAVERNWRSDDEIGSRELEIIHCHLPGAGTVPIGQEIAARIYARVNSAVEELVLGIALRDRFHHTVTAVTRPVVLHGQSKLRAGDLFCFDVTIPGRLNSGEYTLDVGLGSGDRGDGAPRSHFHRVGAIAVIRVFHPGGPATFHGTCNLDARIDWPGLNSD